MRIVLSRKGFDSTAGGGPSPVLEDKTMLSLPIPEIGGEGHTPKNLAEANWHRYDDLILRPEIKKYCKNPRKREQKKHKHCHLDPDIRPELWKKQPDDWQAAFGQCGAAGGHLKNELDLNNIEQENILFLFFGLFRQWKNNKFIGNPFHAIWGYMLCDKVITDIKEMEKKFPCHPHAKLINATNNLLFSAQKGCYGTFKYSERLVLTDLDLQKTAKTKWKIDALPWFEYLKDGTVTMSYHKGECFPEGEDYFQACQGYGQEFVVSSSVDDSEVNWENCSFCDILSNLQKIFP